MKSRPYLLALLIAGALLTLAATRPHTAPGRYHITTTPHHPTILLDTTTGQAFTLIQATNGVHWLPFPALPK